MPKDKNNSIKIDVKKLKKAKNLKIRLLFFAFAMLVFASIFLFEAKLYALINNKNFYGYDLAISQDVQIHFVDVGQGDAMAIRLPDNKKMLIDSGPTKSADKLINYLNNSFFLPKEEKVFDYFLISHTDEDHIGGGKKVFQTFQINMLFRPNIYTVLEAEQLREEYGDSFIDDKNISNKGTLKNFLAQSEKEPNLKIEILDHVALPTINGEGYSFTFLSPIQKTYSSFNDFSSLILFEYGEIKVLFTGDAGNTVEKEVLTLHSSKMEDIDILKVGHHGSSSSTSENFINLTNPMYSVIQVGENSYKHPTEQTLDRLKSVNSNILRNDIHGNIILGFSEKKEVFVFVSTNTFLPVAVEVWQIYLSGGVVLFYFVVMVDYKKIKEKILKNTKKQIAEKWNIKIYKL